MPTTAHSIVRWRFTLIQFDPIARSSSDVWAIESFRDYSLEAGYARPTLDEFVITPPGAPCTLP